MILNTKNFYQFVKTKQTVINLKKEPNSISKGEGKEEECHHHAVHLHALHVNGANHHDVHLSHLHGNNPGTEGLDLEGVREDRVE